MNSFLSPFGFQKLYNCLFFLLNQTNLRLMFSLSSSFIPLNYARDINDNVRSQFCKGFQSPQHRRRVTNSRKGSLQFFLISYQLFFPQQIVGQAAHKEREGRKPFCESFVWLRICTYDTEIRGGFPMACLPGCNSQKMSGQGFCMLTLESSWQQPGACPYLLRKLRIVVGSLTFQCWRISKRIACTQNWTGHYLAVLPVG